jgi:hypothetical protein
MRSWPVVVVQTNAVGVDSTNRDETTYGKIKFLPLQWDVRVVDMES